MVKSQIASLTFDLSFDHNLCFICSNGSREPILDIYASIAFQWYKELFNLMGFDPCNRPLNIWKSTGILTPKMDFNSQNGRSLGSVRVHSLTLFYTLGAWDVTPRLPFRLATLQAFALVASPKLGLSHNKTINKSIGCEWLTTTQIPFNILRCF
jgi:hypothetical protein